MQHYSLLGENYYGIEWDLDQFLDEVSFIRNCIDFTYGRYHSITKWKINCDDKELERQRNKSKLVKWVYLEATQ